MNELLTALAFLLGFGLTAGVIAALGLYLAFAFWREGQRGRAVAALACLAVVATSAVVLFRMYP